MCWLSAVVGWLLRTASGVRAADASAVADEGLRGGLRGRGRVFGGGWVYGWGEATGGSRTGVDCI